MTRAERAVQAAELRKGGMLIREIAAEMGISDSYAQELLADPDGSKVKARKESYRGTCKVCGAKTDGSNGRSGSPAYCHRCVARTNSRVRWGVDEIIAAIKRWHDLYGEIPAAWDWSPAMARYHDATDIDRIEMRWASGNWPAVNSVRHYFGGWNEAIAAAGFDPRRKGGRGLGDRANRWAA